jgi:membrane-associated phospholipid phosphatase
MRTSEWIQAGFAAVLALVAWVRPLAAHRRSAITLFALLAVVAIALARLTQYVFGPLPASILRDWLPVPLTLIPYWQTGQFFSGPDEKIQAWLVASDRWFFSLFSRTGLALGRYVRQSLEWAYALCYGLAFFGLIVLYAAGLRRDADAFWFFALVPTYLCYAITPLVPALPPRSLRSEPCRTESTKSRVFNLWLLKYGSIQAISFPSAHVASALGVSLFFLHELPVAGLVFLFIACWIAVAAVVGGYHYAIDVLLGAAVTLAVYLAWRTHLIPNAFITAPAAAFVRRL